MVVLRVAICIKDKGKASLFRVRGSRQVLPALSWSPHALVAVYSINQADTFACHTQDLEASISSLGRGK